MDFGDFVKKKRLEKKLERSELAYLSKVETNMIKSIEVGVINPTLETSDRICKALGVKYTLGE